MNYDDIEAAMNSLSQSNQSRSKSTPCLDYTYLLSFETSGAWATMTSAAVGLRVRPDSFISIIKIALKNTFPHQREFQQALLQIMK